MYCRYCGREIPDDSKFCQKCGGIQDEFSDEAKQYSGIVCPNCNSKNVTVQLTQENIGSKTTTKTTVSVRKSGHGLLWWLFIGWWWWIIDLMIWIVAFIPRFIFRITKKREVVFGKSKSKTKNDIRYKKHCVCQNCGYTWFAGNGIDSPDGILGLLK